MENTRELIYESDFSKMYLEKYLDLMYVELLGVIDNENYKATFNMMSEKALENGVRRLLVNQSTMQKSSMEAKAWLVTKWLPSARQTFGDRMRAGIVLSKSIFIKIGGEYIISAVRMVSKFDVRSFGDVETARTWLLNDLN